MQYYSLKDFGIAGKTKDAVVDGATSTVVATLYDITGGNGGRKLVRLSNGWIVAAAYSSGAASIYFYKSSDNGSTWTLLTTWSYGGNNANASFALASSGTTVHAITTSSDTTVLQRVKFDATNVSATVSNIFPYLDSNQTEYGSGVSLHVDGNGHIHAAWCSKNSTYLNSFNIRYSKSTDGGVTWAAPTQLTTHDGNSYQFTTPCIITTADNKPLIFGSGQGVMGPGFGGNAGRWCLFCLKEDPTNASKTFIHSAWTDSNPYNLSSGGYTQTNASAAVDSNGVVHVVWQGTDSSDNAKTNIRYSKSSDGGATWLTTPTKLTSGNTYAQSYPTITIDKKNKIFVLFGGFDPSVNANVTNIRRAIFDGTAWRDVETVTQNTSNTNVLFPASLWSFNSVDAAQWIYRDDQASAVKFSSAQYTKVPDTTPSIIETYIPLWWADGGAANHGNAVSPGSVWLANGGLTDSVRLITLNSSWNADRLYSLEVTMMANSGYTANVALWDFTGVALITGSSLSTTATTLTVLRSSSFRLVPGRQYGVTCWSSGGGVTFVSFASLVAFG